VAAARNLLHDMRGRALSAFLLAGLRDRVSSFGPPPALLEAPSDLQHRLVPSEPADDLDAERPAIGVRPDGDIEPAMANEVDPRSKGILIRRMSGPVTDARRCQRRLKTEPPVVWVTG
jgi:hypothetical protein